jgi:hypothetical protein
VRACVQAEKEAMSLQLRAGQRQMQELVKVRAR